ncbi:hypothetical protein BDV33DRAFT_98876 [Aspergillus novoparasiticus]|uniref:Secreted protein n=1 Tax=Aspergillus novoparasiticus TaxID=986946 RepID=A0A5N6ETB7_9EURO|nr:hypothetical protein BDV33DRAFT_98876 [Aspergillus novoparasiticus]
MVLFFFYLGGQLCLQLRPENFCRIVRCAPFLSVPPTPTPCVPCPLNAPSFESLTKIVWKFRVRYRGAGTCKSWTLSCCHTT